MMPIRSMILGLTFSVVKSQAQQVCKPSIQPPNSCIPCANLPITQQNVPASLELLWGTWYTIQATASVTSDTNTCTQVNLTPQTKGQLYSNITYTGSFNTGASPTGSNVQAAGLAYPTSSNAFGQSGVFPYNLEILKGIPPSKFAFLAADSETAPTAAISFSCSDIPAYGLNSAQMFFLSRTPTMSAVTMATLSAQASKAVSNFDLFTFQKIQQGAACKYYLNPTSSSNAVQNHSLPIPAVGVVFIILGALAAMVAAMVVVYRRDEASGYVKAPL